MPPPSPWLRRTMWIAAALLLLLGGLIYALLWRPDFPTREDLPIDDFSALPDRQSVPDAAALAQNGLKVLTFNIHFGTGPISDQDPMPPKAEVEAKLKAIAELIRQGNFDVVMLQEVDRGSARTHYIDQYHELARLSGMRWGAWATTWRKLYVPYPYFPIDHHYGRMWSGQAMLSRLPLKAQTRLALPQPAEYPWWYRAFFLHRAAQHVVLDVPGVGDVHGIHVHAEAFVTPNRRQQAEILSREIHGLPEGTPWFFGGDLNAVPPEAAIRKGFVDEPDQDMSADDTIATYRELPRAAEALPPGLYPDGPLSWTFPASAPNRRLDYIFYDQGAFTGSEGRVMTEAAALSDHLPLTVKLTPRKRNVTPSAEAGTEGASPKPPSGDSAAPHKVGNPGTPPADPQGP